MATKSKEPAIIVVGAGLGGLLLGGLLERMGLQYIILERSEKVKPLGELTSTTHIASLLNRSKLTSIII